MRHRSTAEEKKVGSKEEVKREKEEVRREKEELARKCAGILIWDEKEYIFFPPELCLKETTHYEIQLERVKINVC